jgi:hypothetical protein
MICFTTAEAVRCAERCAECGDIPCWEVVEDCAPCDECRDSDGTAIAAINEDLSVPKDCQARAEGIAQSDMGKPITDAQTPGDTPHDHR